jgi:hypothetical protein
MKLANGAATAPVLGLQFRTLATPSFGDVLQLSSTTQEFPARRGHSDRCEAIRVQLEEEDS